MPSRSHPGSSTTLPSFRQIAQLTIVASGSDMKGHLDFRTGGQRDVLDRTALSRAGYELVAAGSKPREVPGTIVAALRSRRTVFGAPIGEPERIHSRSARPFDGA